MSSPINELQKSLATDLVKLENMDISERHLEMIEQVYQIIYNSTTKVDQRKDNEVH